MDIRTRDLGTVVCLDLRGRLVATDEDDRLRDKVSRLLFDHRRNILLNLEEVSLIDTSGLSAMVAVRQAADRSGGQIKLLNLPSRVHDLLVMTKLITLFDVADSEADAVRAFAAEDERISGRERP